jgi:hypothetical protein
MPCSAPRRSQQHVHVVLDLHRFESTGSHSFTILLHNVFKANVKQFNRQCPGPLGAAQPLLEQHPDLHLHHCPCPRRDL